jgi:glutamate formiminotransferase/glutamate formiminotransferase/formiminotetrahydrofolate cyclodeaminase
MPPPTLLAVPNVSEGRDGAIIEAISRAFATDAEVRLLDVHADGDHDRSVFTLAGAPGELADALVGGAGEAISRIDVMSERDGKRGVHPHIGAIDVVPVVYLDDSARGAACAEALVVADRIGDQLSVPVFLYGELTEAGGHSPSTEAGRHAPSARVPVSASIPVSASGRTRAELRRGGVAGLAGRIAAGELRPDFGPSRPHPTAGATLVAARPPLVAFNLRLSPPATVADARGIAALIREGGPEGLPGLRAIGVELGGGVAQVSMNVERPFEVTLAMVVATVRRHATLASAELVGLAPRAALEDFPRDVPIPGFDPARHLIENSLGC